MSFMQAEIFHGHCQVIRNTREGDIITPEEYAQYPGNEDAAQAYGVSADDVETVFGWFARLSAPGYMDCTEWSGPFDSEQAARDELREMYGDDDDAGIDDENEVVDGE